MDLNKQLLLNQENVSELDPMILWLEYCLTMLFPLIMMMIAIVLILSVVQFFSYWMQFKLYSLINPWMCLWLVCDYDHLLLILVYVYLLSFFIVFVAVVEVNNSEQDGGGSLDRSWTNVAIHLFHFICKYMCRC